MANRKANGTSFKRGRRKTGGRRRGMPNKNTQVLREAALLAAAAAGSETGKNGLYLYLKKVAKKYPSVFLPFLGRLQPLQVESQQTSKTEVTYRSVSKLQQELMRRGVPVDLIYSRLPALTDGTDETGETDKPDSGKPDDTGKSDEDSGEQ